MRRKRLAAGEIRFRVSRDDLKRLDWLTANTDHASVSNMLRVLIKRYYDERKATIDGTKEKGR